MAMARYTFYTPITTIPKEPIRLFIHQDGKLEK